MSDYDFAVIGGGSAGYAAARTAASLGLKTIVLDGGKEIGGLCILRGCMPSKSLIESANRFRAFGQAREFGLRVTDFSYDATEIIARKRRLIGEFADYRREQLETASLSLSGDGHLSSTPIRSRSISWTAPSGQSPLVPPLSPPGPSSMCQRCLAWPIRAHGRATMCWS